MLNLDFPGGITFAHQVLARICPVQQHELTRWVAVRFGVHHHASSNQRIVEDHVLVDRKLESQKPLHGVRTLELPESQQSKVKEGR